LETAPRRRRRTFDALLDLLGCQIAGIPGRQALFKGLKLLLDLSPLCPIRGRGRLIGR
jgi:hypothetical protein